MSTDWKKNRLCQRALWNILVMWEVSYEHQEEGVDTEEEGEELDSTGQGQDLVWSSEINFFPVNNTVLFYDGGGRFDEEKWVFPGTFFFWKKTFGRYNKALARREIADFHAYICLSPPVTLRSGLWQLLRPFSRIRRPNLFTSQHFLNFSGSALIYVFLGCCGNNFYRWGVPESRAGVRSCTKTVSLCVCVRPLIFFLGRCLLFVLLLLLFLLLFLLFFLLLLLLLFVFISRIRILARVTSKRISTMSNHVKRLRKTRVNVCCCCFATYGIQGCPKVVAVRMSTRWRLLRAPSEIVGYHNCNKFLTI